MWSQSRHSPLSRQACRREGIRRRGGEEALTWRTIHAVHLRLTGAPPVAPFRSDGTETRTDSQKDREENALRRGHGKAKAGRPEASDSSVGEEIDGSYQVGGGQEGDGPDEEFGRTGKGDRPHCNRS